MSWVRYGPWRFSGTLRWRTKGKERVLVQEWERDVFTKYWCLGREDVRKETTEREVGCNSNSPLPWEHK